MQLRNRAQPLGKPLSLAALAAFSMSVLAPTGARAEVLSGSSSGYGVYADLNLLAINLLTVGPAGTSSGTAPPPYSTSGTFAGVNASVLLLANITSGIITSSASSNVDGALGSRQATATGGVDNASVTLGIPLIGNPILALTATTLSSTSTVSGDFGVLNPTGTSTITGLNISILGGPPLIIPVNPAPNTGLAIVGVVGLSIILNEQIVTSNANQTSIQTNAVAIRLNAVNIAGIGLVSGEILLGHSEALLFAAADPPPVAVPEPSSLALLGLGAGMMSLVGGRRWIRRRKAAC